jgi:hypothetical protein
MQCASSKGLEQLFQEALPRLVPTLAKHDPQRKDQHISNVMYAGARAGANGCRWQEYVAAVAAGHAAGTAMASAIPQEWSNLLWACKQLEVYDAAFLSTAAQAMVQAAKAADAQSLTNTLTALSDLGWYEPAVYDAVVTALVAKTSDTVPQGYSNALYACCLAQHVTPAVHKLAEAALFKFSARQWTTQHVANILLACAVLMLPAETSRSSRQTSLAQLFKVLFDAASQNRPNAYSPRQLRQLYRAQRKAQASDRPCLPASSPLYAAVEEAWMSDLHMLVQRQPLPLQHAVNSAAAATGRYSVIPPSIKGGWRLIQGEVQHKQLGYHVMLFALSKDRYFQHPLGKVTGPTQLQIDELSTLFQCTVVVYEHEWQALGSSTGAQAAHMDQLLQQAEAAIAAAAQQQQQQQTGRVESADSSRPAPIIIGLLPQGPTAQAEAGSQQGATTTDASTTHEPPQPVLTPAEAEARLKALQQQALQQQQAFLKGLPPAPASGLSQGARSPGQHQQQQQQQQVLRPPQAPALKPPRRPGA